MTEWTTGPATSTAAAPWPAGGPHGHAWWNSGTWSRPRRDFCWEPKDGFIGMQGYCPPAAGIGPISHRPPFVDTNPAAGEIPAIRDGIKPDHPYEDLANIITSQVRTYGVGGEEVLWDVDGFPDSGQFGFHHRHSLPLAKTPVGEQCGREFLDGPGRGYGLRCPGRRNPDADHRRERGHNSHPEHQR